MPMPWESLLLKKLSSSITLRMADDPWPVRYVRYIGDVAHGNLVPTALLTIQLLKNFELLLK